MEISPTRKAMRIMAAPPSSRARVAICQSRGEKNRGEKKIIIQFSKKSPQASQKQETVMNTGAASRLR